MIIISLIGGMIIISKYEKPKYQNQIEIINIIYGSLIHLYCCVVASGCPNLS